MPEARKTRKMVNIDVVETSGVDHPAHLQEGWVVMKSATEAEVENLFGPITKANKEEVVAEKEANETAEAVQKAADAQAALEALQKKYDALVAKTTVTKAAEETEEEIFKALPEPVRVMLEKQAEAIEKARQEAAADREELAKERDARLDERAITESKAMFKSLGIDHNVVAPALRRLALTDATTAEAVTGVLKAAEGQLESAGLFAEIGKSAHNAENVTSVGKATEIAKSLREADPTLTESQAIARAYAANPALYTDFLEGK